MSRPRLGWNDNIMDMLVKMSEGNPGASVALMEIIKDHDKIDPQAMLGPLSAIMILDTWQIYGTDIYVLYNDKCNRDTRKMLMIMRATQLGLFPESKLREMANDQTRSINLSEEEWEELDKKVCEQLVDFQRPTQD